MEWESWLRRASRPPSDNEDSKRERTERQIKDALAAYQSLRGKQYRVYAKGSYANNTNVRLNYDVDIAVEYFGFFYYDLDFALKGKDKSVVGIVDSDDTYGRDAFKEDVLGALNAEFGVRAVSAGKIAFRVRDGRTTLPADVVPCWEYRRYDGATLNGQNSYHQGSRVFPSGGGYKDNFPQIQRSNGVAKNDRTGRRYKRMVRALKKLQSKLVAEGRLPRELPSYLLECLVYNVSDDHFNHFENYGADFRDVLATIFNATLTSGASDDWREVHELCYLFRGASDWNERDVHQMVDTMWNYIGFE